MCNSEYSVEVFDYIKNILLDKVDGLDANSAYNCMRIYEDRYKDQETIQVKLIEP